MTIHLFDTKSYMSYVFSPCSIERLDETAVMISLANGEHYLFISDKGQISHMISGVVNSGFSTYRWNGIVKQVLNLGTSKQSTGPTYAELFQQENERRRQSNFSPRVYAEFDECDD